MGVGRSTQGRGVRKGVVFRDLGLLGQQCSAQPNQTADQRILGSWKFLSHWLLKMLTEAV